VLDTAAVLSLYKHGGLVPLSQLCPSKYQAEDYTDTVLRREHGHQLRSSDNTMRRIDVLM
jgi:hypothetical protein